MPDKAPFCQPEVELFTKLRGFGWSPRSVYDVGAASGWWSVNVSKVFAGAEFHLFEPLADHHPKYAADFARSLTQVRGGDGRGNAAPGRLHKLVLSDHEGPVTFHVDPQGWGSSVHKLDCQHTSTVTVPARRLDNLVAELGLTPPGLIKLDTQGNEDAVLRGCGSLLETAEALLIESSLMRWYGPANPLLTELVEWLRNRRFRLVNFGNEFYGEYHELAQVDALFMHERTLDAIKVASNGWQW